MASPIQDTTFGTLTGHNHSLTSPASFGISGTNKTAGANEVVVLCIAYELRSGSDVTVSSVTVSGLTFTHFATVTNTTLGAANCTIEVWVAQASAAFNASATNLTYTISWTSGTEVDATAAVIFAVSGCASISAPFDPDSPASAFNTTNTTAPTVTFSTKFADDLLVGLSANINPFGGNLLPTAPSGWSLISSPNDNNGLNGCILGFFTKSVSAVQTNATFKDAATGNQTSWTEMVVAFTADKSLPHSQVAFTGG
jgi:hypothetical protein